jgi:hypothetical protein
VFEESVQGLCAYHVRTAIQQGLQQKLLGRGEEKEAAHRAFNKHVEEIMYMKPCADEATTRQAANKMLLDFKNKCVVLFLMFLRSFDFHLTTHTTG